MGKIFAAICQYFLSKFSIFSATYVATADEFGAILWLHLK